MSDSSIAQLKSKFTDKYVKVESPRPELARFAGMVGRVVTVNENGMALVDFSDGPWYDLATDVLVMVPKPEKKAPPAHEKPAPKAAAGAPAGEKKVVAKKPVPKPAAEPVLKPAAESGAEA